MKACKNWESSAKINEEINCQSNIRPMPKNYLVGKCNSIVLAHEFESNKSAILADDEGGCWAAMYTAEESGCVLFAEKMND